MKIKYLLLGIAVAGCMSSCDDFLDVKPMGKLIPEEVSHYENLLNNAGTRSLSSHAIEWWSDNFEMTENEALYRWKKKNIYYAAYVFYQPCYDVFTQSDYVLRDGLFKAIYYFNNVVDGIESLGNTGEDSHAKEVIAQAKAGRAWAYMTAALLYGPMYDPSGANDTKVLPYRTVGDPNIGNPDRATTGEIFQKLKEDLDYAVEHGPDVVASPLRADKATSYALRAMLHMYMRNWKEMYNDANKAWELSVENYGGIENLIYDYEDFYYIENESATSKQGEDVRTYLNLAHKTDAAFNKAYMRENMLYRDGYNRPSGSDWKSSDDYLALFDKQTDLRYKLFILQDIGYSTTQQGVTYDDGLCYRDYRNDTKKISYMTIGITYPEVLLMRAEAQARDNQLGGALADLNLLRKYRYEGDNTDLANGASLSQDELLEEIINERRREQYSASPSRIFDLKRYAFDTGKPWSKPTIVHKVGSKSYSCPVGELIRPIPNDVIVLNPAWGMKEWEGSFAPEDLP